MKSRALWYVFSGLLWVGVPFAASAAGLVPCQGAADCNICTFGSLIQNIINFAIGLSIPLAAVMFAYAGWLYFSNRENMAQIEKAHSIFRTVFIGFCIALAAWLIIQTVLKTLAPGYQSWTTFTCNNANRTGSGAPGSKTPGIGDLFQQSGLPGLSTVPPLGNQNYGGQINPSTGCAQDDYFSNGSCTNAYGGTYTPASTANCDPELGCFTSSGPNGNIASAAAAYKDTDTSAGPENGYLACAWAVNNILQNEGIAPIDGNLVYNMEQELINGRGTQVDPSEAHGGDIVVWKTDTVSHVGICYNADCSQVISNSSGDAKFNNFSGQVFRGVQGRIYRVNR